MYHQRLGIREIEKNPLWYVTDDFGNSRVVSIVALVLLGNEVALTRQVEWEKFSRKSCMEISLCYN